MQQGSAELRSYISKAEWVQKWNCRHSAAGEGVASQQTSQAPDTTPLRQSFPLLSLKPICVLISSAVLLPSIWNRWNDLHELFVIVLKLYVQASKTGQIGTGRVAFPWAEKTERKFMKLHIKQRTPRSPFLSPAWILSFSQALTSAPFRVCVPRRLRTHSNRVGGQSVKVFIEPDPPPLLLSHCRGEQRCSQREALTLSDDKGHSSGWWAVKSSLGLILTVYLVF